MKKSLQSLLDFSVRFDSCREERSVYEELALFLKKTFTTSRPFIVFSKPIRKSPIDQCRIVFNRDLCSEHYTQQELAQVLTPIVQEIESAKGGNISQWRGDEKNFVSFYLGERGNQVFFGFFSLKEELDPDFVKNMRLLIKRISEGVEKLKYFKAIENLIHLDDITGLYNQRKLHKDLDQAILRYHRSKERFSLLFMDIDSFKGVNDKYGHLTGTAILKQVASFLKKFLREADLIYRYGGDEFVILIPGLDSQMSDKIAQRILSFSQQTHFEVPFSNNKTLKLAFSMGIAEFPRDAKSKDEILDLADQMMYEAKRKGGGQVYKKSSNRQSSCSFQPQN